MAETKRENALSIDELVTVLKESGKFKPEEISIELKDGEYLMKNYSAFYYLAKKLEENVTVNQLPGNGIPVRKVTFTRKGMNVSSYQSPNEGIPAP